MLAAPAFPTRPRSLESTAGRPILRLAGGHAAAYDDECVIVEVVRPAERAIGDLDSRFQEVASLLRSATASAGVSLELGQLPGEYCPGRFSLHLIGGPKVGGIAQRVIKAPRLPQQ